jgi:hypothetical protein
MIEIKVSEDGQPAHPDGPHDHEQTRAIAAGIDEACRLLNYATMSRYGLRYPSDVYSVLGTLSGAVGKLPQSLTQMTTFVAGEVSGGHARENASYGEHGGDAEAAHEALVAAMQEAAEHAAALARALQAGQSAMRGMESTRDG